MPLPAEVAKHKIVVVTKGAKLIIKKNKRKECDFCDGMLIWLNSHDNFVQYQVNDLCEVSKLLSV